MPSVTTRNALTSSAPTFAQWLVGGYRPAIDARAERDPRIDTIRGLALLMIFINHIPMNPASAGTLAAFTFHDAAEVFVLLAGYSAMLAYRRGFATGFVQGSRPIFARIRIIYGVQVALAVSLLALGLLLTSITGHGFYVNHLELHDFLDAPVTSVTAVFALLFQPSYADILPMYVVMMAMLPLVIVTIERSPLLALLASGIIYAGANAFGANLPQVHENTWFFNPLAWQFIFVAGAVAGHATLAGVRLPRSVDAAVLAAGLLIFAVSVKAPWAAFGLSAFPNFEAFGVSAADLSKTWVHPLRLLSLLALAYLTAILISPTAAWMKSRIAVTLQAMGRASLPVFALGTLLSFLGTAAIVESGRSPLMIAIVNLAGIMLLIATPGLLGQKSEQHPKPRLSANAPAQQVALA